MLAQANLLQVYRRLPKKKRKILFGTEHLQISRRNVFKLSKNKFVNDRSSPKIVL